MSFHLILVSTVSVEIRKTYPGEKNLLDPLDVLITILQRNRINILSTMTHAIVREKWSWQVWKMKGSTKRLRNSSEPLC